MEQDVENNVREDTIVLLDDKMLSKLRGCNMVPRSLPGFQVFAKSLIGDTISDEVIQEAWKYIFPGHASLPTSERNSDSQKLTLNDSSKSDGKVTTDFLPEFSISSGKVPNQKHGSHSDNQIFKKTKKCRSESGVKKSYMDTSFSDTATQHPVSKQSIALHSFAPVGRKEVSRKITCPVKTVEEMKQSFVGKSNKTNVPLKEDCKEEQSSSDCEIIEMIVERSGVNDSNSDSGLVSDDDNKSDSDESVEILDSSESEDDKDIKRPCLRHGSHKRKAQHVNCCPKRKSMHIEADSVESKENESCEESVNKGKQQKDKRGKRGELKMLMSEVKHLRSAFVNFVLSLKCPTSTGREDVSRDLDNMSFTSDNNQKAGGNESFGPKQSRKKTGSKNTRTGSSTEKLHASAFVEVKMSRETTESPSKRKYTAKHPRKSSEEPPIVVDLDSDNEDKEKREKFPWRENIVYELRSTRGKWMTVEKLKRRIIARYYCCRGSISNNTPVKFLKYLHSTTGVIVVGEKAIYSNKPIIKVSSKSERKQFVLERHKTSKECRVS